ncbi:MAG TPA: GYD domain-containing protein [Casimicrobiaceae bacterium]|nr:GYD domain-containing protein [Casimicrobiaceae bacterium]
MATYIVLSKFTDQGIRTVKDTTKRAEKLKTAVKKMGVTMTDIRWTIGRYDLVVTFDAPDDAAMTAVCLAIGAQGNVRSETLRAFTSAEMDAILAKVK